MNKITNIFLAILVVLVGYGIFKNHSLDLNISEHKYNTITVAGKAEKKLVPDTAKISFSVNEYRKNQKEAAKIVNKKTKKIIEALKDLGIDEKDIKTRNYSVYPEYDWINDKRTFRDYKVSQSVEVKIKDLEKISKVLAKVVELKVDNLNGPNMYIDNLDEIKEKMRVDAIEDAKKKAEELADELGVKLDKIVGFSESRNSNYYPRPMYKAMVMADADPAEKIPEPEINPGEQKITKTVSISFQIED